MYLNGFADLLDCVFHFFIVELPGFSRGSRMLGLMNLGAQPGTHSQTLPHMMPQSPVNTMPRSPYNDSRLNSIQPPPQNQGSFPGSFPNGKIKTHNFIFLAPYDVCG